MSACDHMNEGEREQWGITFSSYRHFITSSLLVATMSVLLIRTDCQLLVNYRTYNIGLAIVEPNSIDGNKQRSHRGGGGAYINDRIWKMSTLITVKVDVIDATLHQPADRTCEISTSTATVYDMPWTLSSFTKILIMCVGGILFDISYKKCLHKN